MSAVALILFCGDVFAQGAIQQDGPVVPGHIGAWTANGRMGDGGSSPLPPAGQIALGQIWLFPPTTGSSSSSSTSWQTVTTDGSAVPGCLTTTSNCFNEVMAYAAIRGWNVTVNGCTEFVGEGAGPPKCQMIATSSAGFVIPPMADQSLTLNGVQMICNGAANLGCVNVDSMEKGKIICNGCEIGSQPDTGDAAHTCAWLLDPHTPLFSEGAIAISDSKIEMGNSTVFPKAGTGLGVICMNIGTGSINVNEIDWTEANGGGATSVPNVTYTVFISGANGSFGFGGNLITGAHTHLGSLAGLQIGASTGNANNYTGNVATLGTIFPGYQATSAINTFASQWHVTVGIINNGENTSGVPYSWMTFAHAGAVQNTFEIASGSGANCGGSCSNGNPGFSGDTDAATWQNNYKVNGQWYNQLFPGGQINTLAPFSLSGCGTTPAGTIAGGSTTHKGTVQIGGSSPTACQVNWAFTAAVALHCTWTPHSYIGALFQSAATTTANEFTSQAGMAQGTLVDWMCQ